MSVQAQLFGLMEVQETGLYPQTQERARTWHSAKSHAGGLGLGMVRKDRSKRSVTRIGQNGY